ncbi:hypothetical protein Ddc_14971 [Ditylenchus destructor]|nr:hypothetical protein Ddc_14971 [Ditylenchus destructor]
MNCILKFVTSNSTLEKLLNTVTDRIIVSSIGLGGSMVVTVSLKFFKADFFSRKDYFCWIRPDYVVPAVVTPITLVGLNAVFVFPIISIKITSHKNNSYDSNGPITNTGNSGLRLSEKTYFTILHTTQPRSTLDLSILFDFCSTSYKD